MIVKFGRFGGKAILIWMECLAIVVGLILLGGIVFSWRLGTGPVDISFARETVQQALQDPVSGYSVTMGGIVLEWPDLSGPIMLRLDNVGLIKSGKEVLNVGEVDLGISATHLLRADIKPLTISLAKSSLHLIRTAENDIVFSLEDDKTPVPEETAGGENPLMRLVNALSRPEGAIDSRSPIDHLRRVEISDATMVMEDHVLGISWYLQDMNLAFARNPSGLEVGAEINLPGGRNGAALLRGSAVYDRQRKDFRIAAHIEDLDPRIVSRKVEKLSFMDGHELFLNGDFVMTVNESLEILGAEGKLSADDGSLKIDGVYDRPLAFQKLAFDAAYDPASETIDVREASIRAFDVGLKVSGTVTAGAEKISAPVKIEIPSLPQEKIKDIWPDVMRGEPIEAWLLERLSEGSIDNINAALTIDAAKGAEGWTIGVSGIAGGFDINNMKVDYRAPLTAATKTFGRGKLENDVLQITIDSAHVADMTVSGGTVTIDNIVADKVGNAHIDVALKAALPSLFKYVESEPIGMKGADLGLDTKNVKGDAALDVEVSFPTLRDLPKDKVKVKVGGTLDNVSLPDVVKTLDLTGGPMKLTVAEGKALLSGAGKLDGRPVKLDWEQFLESEGKPYSSKIKAQLDADRDLRMKLNIGLDDWLDGTVPVKVDYTEYASGRGEVLVAGNLKPATVKVTPFDYEKPPGVEGSVTCTAILQDGAVQEIRALNVKTPELDVTNGVMTFDSVNGVNVLRRGNMERVKLNETDTMLDFEIGKGGQLKVGLRGTFFDARPFLKKKRKKGPYEGPPILASVDVAKMRSSDTQIISRAKIYLNLNKDGMVNQLELDAVAGKGAVYMRLKPDAARGVTVFRLEADDAGAALKAFDVYKNVRGGKFLLTGESAPGKSRYVINGKAQLSDFNVVNAPALAVLVSAISPTGLPMLLSNDGLFFSQLESKFSWHLRQPGDTYIIRDGRTSGSSLGLTFEGKVDKESGMVDINGHVVPMSEINSLISNIPLIGDILTGGSEGGIFAATYTMTGPTEKPVVSINPLSVLTPGIIRRILFED